ncbi:Esterase-6, partial [Mortierella alpina]
MSSKELVLDVQNYAQSVPKSQRRWYDASVGNWGFLDQILGLEWIRDHIRAFGGDPARVTLMGESAGGASISYLQLIPECHGLFNRAILLSGTASCSPTMRPEYEGQRYFDHICRVFGIPADAPPLDKVARLRAIPEKELAEELNSSEVVLFGPTLDGVLFKKDSRLTIGDASLYDPNFSW